MSESDGDRRAGTARDHRRRDDLPVAQMQRHHQHRPVAGAGADEMLGTLDPDAAGRPQPVEDRELDHRPAGIVEQPHRRPVGVARRRVAAGQLQIAPPRPFALGLEAVSPVEGADSGADRRTPVERQHATAGQEQKIERSEQRIANPIAPPLAQPSAQRSPPRPRRGA